MIGFLLRRVGYGIVVVAAVTTVVFVVTRVIGDPAQAELSLSATAAQRADYNRGLGLDKPIAVQYERYLRGVVQGDFGTSLRLRRPALGVVLQFLPRTLELVASGMALAALLAIMLGVAAALRPGRALDRVVAGAALAAISAPHFVVGLLLIIVFGVGLHWLPVSGSEGVTALIAPAITLAAPGTGRVALIIRASMLQELDRPYVLTAQAKGLSRRRILLVHALRNAITPAIGLLGLELAGALAGGDVVVEAVFGWPGIGHLALDSISGQDYAQLQAIVLVVAILVVIVNVCVDILYRIVDPRVGIQ